MHGHPGPHVLHGAFWFSEKAWQKLHHDDLSAMEVIEAILNAPVINKTVRSRSRFRSHAHEKLYIIKGFSYSGTAIYTKGTIKSEAGQEVFYLFISAKIATHNE